MDDELATASGADGPRRVWGLVVAVVAFAGLWMCPFALAPQAHRLAAILGAVVVLWVSEALPLTITGFLGVAAAVVLGVAPAAEAFAPFADPLIFVFVGTFMLARAMFHQGVDRRVAYAILGMPWIGDHPVRILVAFGTATGLISMWISNTATVAMMIPVALAVLRTLETNGGAGERGFGAALLLAASFGASIGGLGTPVGTPPNLIGLGLLRETGAPAVTFFAWMAVGTPIVALLGSCAVATLARDLRRGGRVIGVERYVRDARRALGPWTRGQRNAVAAFACTVVLWLVPGVLALVLGPTHEVTRAVAARIPEGVAALLGAVLLFVLPADRERSRPTLPWGEAAQIEWSIVFLYGAGMALGTLAFKTGLASSLGASIAHAAGVSSVTGLVVMSTALATLLSETTSNTASANMVVPVVIAIARAADIDPVLPAIGATMGSSLGFMLPVSTPCNAMVYGTGHVPLRTMLRHGLILDLAGIVVVSAAVLILGPLVFGAR